MSDIEFIFVDNKDFDETNLFIASWNVNSLKCRMDKVVDWLKKFQPLVLTLQEVRCDEDKLDWRPILRLGYNYVCHSKGGRNGVAIIYVDITRENFTTRLLSVKRDIKNQPLWTDCNEINERRALSIEYKITKNDKSTVFNIYSLYIPNGRALDNPHFEYKLEFLNMLRKEVEGKQNLILTGDFNVAPRDEDVWNVEAFAGCTHVTPAERECITALNLRDVIPEYGMESGEKKMSPFTYWGYIGGLFWKDKGMRIDLMLTNSNALVQTFVDRDSRRLPKCSDHTPIVGKIIL